jgi:hypothetical protein
VKNFAAILVLVTSGWAGRALAQVPVIDQATLNQSTQTASNTAAIMSSNAQILTQTMATLAAVSGTRTTGAMTSAALGGGFTMSSAPSLSSILGGGQMSWGGLGAYGQTAAAMVNGLNLVQTLSGNATGVRTGADTAYQGAVKTAAALAGVVAGAQTAATARAAALKATGALVGSAPDIKGSIDQNSQMQVQTALVINELIGVMNGANAALNAQAMQELAGQSKATQIMTYDAAKATLVSR